jgi:acyl dehydratase
MILAPVALTVAIATVLAVARLPSHISNIFRATRSTNGRLSFKPTDLSGIDIIALVLLIISKYGNKLIGRHPALKAADNGKGFLLPRITLSAALQVNKSDIDKFNTAVDDKQRESRDEDSPPLLLPAVTTPLLLIMLSNFSCPVLPFGAVNTKNRFEFLDPVACRSVDSIEDATATARLGGDDLLGRRVKRGMEFEIVIDVEGKPNGVGEKKILFRQIFGIMVFLPKSLKPIWDGRTDIADTNDSITLSEELSQQIKLSLNAPMKWAAVCKDVNPIHMSSLAAKMFGFPGKIAHGNHVVAYVIEQQRDVDVVKYPSRRLCWESEKPWFLSVEFKRPIVLPAVLETKFAVEDDETNQSKYRFQVMRGDKTHVTGSYGLL